MHWKINEIQSSPIKGTLMLTGREKCENNVKESSTAVDQLELME